MGEIQIKKAKMDNLHEVKSLLLNLHKYLRSFNCHLKEVSEVKDVFDRYCRDKLNSDSSVVFVAKNKDKVVGAVIGEEKENPLFDGNLGSVIDMFVWKDYRGKKYRQEINE